MASALDPEDQDPPRSQVLIDIVTYDQERGVVSFWDKGSMLRISVLPSPELTVVISGNTPGLISLARHLLTLAQPTVPDGRHLDFDTYDGWLGEGSENLRIEIEK